MLRDWLGPTPLDTFLNESLQRQPLAAPQTTRAALPLFDWSTFDSLLQIGPAVDLLIVAGGREVDAPRPRNLQQARALMRRGIGFSIRHSEEHDPGLARVAAGFATDLPGVVHVQLFITPGATHGFGWHYDGEDVFIAHTAGIKDYYFRANTVVAADPKGSPDFAALFRRETSPIMTARLGAGDFLYLPSRWWHVAKCVEDSLSISVGVFPRARRSDPARQAP